MNKINLSVTILLIVIIYLIYRLIAPHPPASPCDAIFQQTTLQLSSKLDILKQEGEISIGDKNLQTLSDANMQLAINAKTCCIMTMNNKLSGKEFLECKDGEHYLSQYQDIIDSLVLVVKSNKLSNNAQDSLNMSRNHTAIKKLMNRVYDIKNELNDSKKSNIDTSAHSELKTPSKTSSRTKTNISHPVPFEILQRRLTNHDQEIGISGYGDSETNYCSITIENAQGKIINENYEKHYELLNGLGTFLPLQINDNDLPTLSNVIGGRVVITVAKSYKGTCDLKLVFNGKMGDRALKVSYWALSKKISFDASDRGKISIPLSSDDLSLWE